MEAKTVNRTGYYKKQGQPLEKSPARTEYISDKRDDSVLNDTSRRKTKRNIGYLVLTTYFLGVVFGSLIISYTKSQAGDLLCQIVKKQFMMMREYSLVKLISTNCISIIGFTLLIYLFGFFAFSQILTLTAVFSKALVFSAYAAYIIREYRIDGGVYIALTELLGLILFILLIYLSSRESIMFSSALISRIRSSKRVVVDTRLYNLRFVIFFIFAFIISIINGLTMMFFRFYIS